jgi:hypothetical protein
MGQQSNPFGRWLWVIGIAFLCLTVLITLDLVTSSTGYYGPADAFGPFSRYALFFVVVFVLVGVFSAIAWQGRGKYNVILTAPILVLILFKFMVPQSMDSYYATSFYDALGHLSRGLYVAVTGHSDPSVDSYFGLQPGFFWETAIIFNVISGVPTSLTSSLPLIVLKWFPILIALLYVPILWLLYKELIANRVLVSAAIVAQFALSTSPFHYAAQTYVDALFWLVLALMFIAWDRGSQKYLGLVLLTGISLIFVHEGATFMTALMLISVAMYQTLFRNRIRLAGSTRRVFVILSLNFVAIWLGYLSFWALSTFGIFISDFRSVIETLVERSTSLVSSELSRSNPVWGAVVFDKFLFFLALIASGLLTSLCNVYRRRDEKDKLVLFMLLFVNAFFGSVAVASGGAGYIERLPEMTLPLIVYSVIRLAAGFGMQNRTFPSKWVPFLLIGLISVSSIVGTAFYFSGWNFQSLTYGEVYSNSFLTSETPNNIIGLYPGSPITTLLQFVQSQVVEHSGFISQITWVTRHDYIQADYYLTGNMTGVNDVVNSLSNSSDRIYANPDSVVFVNP